MFTSNDDEVTDCFHLCLCYFSNSNGNASACVQLCVVISGFGIYGAAVIPHLVRYISVKEWCNLKNRVKVEPRYVEPRHFQCLERPQTQILHVLLEFNRLLLMFPLSCGVPQD